MHIQQFLLLFHKFMHYKHCLPIVFTNYFEPNKNMHKHRPGWLTYSGRFTHKWSPVSCRSSTEQGKFACQRPTFHRCATQPTTVIGINKNFGKRSIKHHGFFGINSPIYFFECGRGTSFVVSPIFHA